MHETRENIVISIKRTTSKNTAEFDRYEDHDSTLTFFYQEN